jgi:hypothetical protein
VYGQVKYVPSSEPDLPLPASPPGLTTWRNAGPHRCKPHSDATTRLAYACHGGSGLEFAKCAAENANLIRSTEHNGHV